MRFLFGFSSVLKGFFDVFEAPEGAFWASWDSLGSLLEPLGPPWGEVGVVLGRLLGHFDFLLFFGTNLEAKRAPKGRHFGSQNGAKIDPKSRCEFNNEKVTS